MDLSIGELPYAIVETQFLALELAYGDDPRLSEIAKFLRKPFNDWGDEQTQWLQAYLAWRRSGRKA